MLDDSVCTDLPTDNVAFEGFVWRKNFTCASCAQTWCTDPAEGCIPGQRTDHCGEVIAMGLKAPNPDGCLLKWAEPWATRLTEGTSDPMLNTRTAVPDTLSPPQDEGGDAHDLQVELQRLARPDRVSLSSTTFLLHPWEAGVGMTVQMLVQPVLEALADGHTLIAPHLDIWADPVRAKTCDYE